MRVAAGFTINLLSGIGFAPSRSESNHALIVLVSLSSLYHEWGQAGLVSGRRIKLDGAS